MDGDCQERPHGHCEAVQVTGVLRNICFYGCVEDSECGSGSICVCHDPVGVCKSAQCKTDAECGPGLSCASHADALTEWEYLGPRLAGFACQTAVDQCIYSYGQCAPGPNGTFCGLEGDQRACIVGGCSQ